MDISAGRAQRVELGSLADAIGAYFDAREERLRPRTAKLYRKATGELLSWAREHGIAEHIDRLDKAALLRFRQHLLSQRKRVQKAGGERWEYEATKAPRSAQTVNAHLRACASVLSWCRDHERLACSQDDIADGLKREPVEDRELPAPVARERLRELMGAAVEHEAHAAPFILALLLGGFRYSEGRLLHWSRVGSRCRRDQLDAGRHEDAARPASRARAEPGAG